MMHPSEQIRGNKGDYLEGMKIVLGVTGSIAAVECVKLIRELIREGAEVHCVTSGYAEKIIHPYSLEFASGNDVITELTGQVEHVKLCGDVPDKADLFLIAPATANTISKIAHGIDDTPVTTFATTAIGSDIPLLIVPAMHKSMYRHQIITENVDKLKSIGVKFIGPRMEEGTAKVAEIGWIVDEIIRSLDDRLMGREIVVVTGSTREPIDSMRVITNKATGKSGIELAKRAYRRGAKVELWYGNTKIQVPHWIDNRSFDSMEDLLRLVEGEYDVMMVPAALSDFGVKEVSKSKLSSYEPQELELQPMPKFIEKVREKVDFLVAYKAEDNREEAMKEAKAMINQGRADLVVANSLQDVEDDRNRVYLLGDGKWFDGGKGEIADRILDELEN